DAYLSAGKRSKVSAPLSLQALEGARFRFSPDEYRWLRATVDLGLRPSEADQLNDRNAQGDPTIWRTERDENGIDILHVYQSKLRNVARANRWKLIPIILNGQRETLQFIRDALPLSRPTAVKVERCFGTGVKLYGGRKNFVDHCLN